MTIGSGFREDAGATEVREDDVMARASTGSPQQLFAYRYGAAPAAPEPSAGGDTLAYLAGRRSCRDYLDRAVDPTLVETLAAAAFCAPT